MAPIKLNVEVPTPEIHPAHPCDKLCLDIFNAMWANFWSIPGVSMKLETAKIEDDFYAYVSEIEGADFIIRYRIFYDIEKQEPIVQTKQVSIGNYNVMLNADGSGPKVLLYVGKGGDEELQAFHRRVKLGAKAAGEPRTYLLYHGTGYVQPGTVATQISCQLISSTGEKTEYWFGKDEAPSLNTEKVFSEINKQLADVLQYIERYYG